MKKIIFTLTHFIVFATTMQAQDITTNLIAHYPFSNNTNDTTANNNDGTGTGIVYTNDINNNANKACLMDGNDYVTLPTIDMLGAEITVSTWFKGTGPYSVVRQQLASDYWSLGYGYNGYYYAILSNDGGTATGSFLGTSTELQDDTWHHFVMVWKQNTTKGFKTFTDGIKRDERNSSNNPLPAIASAIYVGSLNGTNEFAIGTVDEVRIYKRALSDADVLEIYNTEKKIVTTDLLSSEDRRLFSIHPNPVVNEVSFELSEGGNFSVYNAQGALILSQELYLGPQTVSLESFPSGIYNLIFRGQDGSISQKKLVKK